MQAGYAKRRIVLLGGCVYPVQVPFARKKLTSLEDMTRLKMRVTLPEQGEFVKRFGGFPITMGVNYVNSYIIANKAAFDALPADV